MPENFSGTTTRWLEHTAWRPQITGLKRVLDDLKLDILICDAESDDDDGMLCVCGLVWSCKKKQAKFSSMGCTMTACI